MLQRKKDQSEEKDLLSFLPKDMHLSILSFLEPRHLFALSLVSKQFKQLTEDNHLWFNLFARISRQPQLKYPNNEVNNFKEKYKVYKEFAKFREIANELEKLNKNKNSWRGAFIDLFSKLVNAASQGISYGKTADALMGALIFESMTMHDGLRYIQANNFFSMVGSGPRCSLTNERYLFIQSKLNIVSNHYPYYLSEFYRCIEHISDNMINGLRWKNKAALLEDIGSMRERKEKEIQEEYISKIPFGLL